MSIVFCRGIRISLRQDPLDLSFWSFLTFLHHGIDDVEGHFSENFTKKFKGKVGQMCHLVLACIGFLYKVVHKSGRLRKFNGAREIAFNFFIAWTIFMKLGTLNIFVSPHQQTVLQSTTFRPDCPSHFQVSLKMAGAIRPKRHALQNSLLVW